MRTKFAMVWIPLALAGFAAAAEKWERHALPSMLEMVEPMYSLDFVDANRGVTVGQNGWILLTENGGVDWKHQQVRPGGSGGFYWNAVLREGAQIVAFGNSGTGQSPVGYRAESNDAGKTWDIRKSGVDSIFFDVISSAPGVYFTSANRDRMLKSKDAGLTWTRMQLPLGTGLPRTGQYSVSDISFPSANVGYAVGSDYAYGAGNVLLKTTDAGETWNRLAEKSGMMEVEFPTADTGYILEFRFDEAMVLRTVNGGASFDTTITTIGPAQFTRMVFESTLSGWALQSSGRVFRTQDGGKTWTKDGLAVPERGVYENPLYANNGALFRMHRASIRFSKNGGKDWTSGSRGKNGTFTNIVFPSGSQGCILGDDGTFLRTETGGLTWSGVALGAQSEPYDLQFTDANTGFMKDSWGKLHKSVDGGKTWVNPVVDLKDSVYVPWFTDSRNGRAQGTKGNLMRSLDGGATWTAEGAMPWGLFDFRVPGFIGIAELGKSYTSSDDGKTWDTTLYTWPRDQGDPWPVANALHFRDAKLGFLVGKGHRYSGFIARTSDGGKNWAVQSDTSWRDIREVTFAGGDTMYAYGANYDEGAGCALILKSLDAGATWTRMEVDKTAQHGLDEFNLSGITSLTFSEGTGWAVGAGGTLLKLPGPGGASVRQAKLHAGWIQVGNGRVSLYLPEAARVDLGFADMSGRSVGKIFSGNIKAGTTSFRLPGTGGPRTQVLVITVNGRTRYLKPGHSALP